MITNIKIENFKSVADLSIELGRFNVFIGENGCGKSNILEAIAFGAAANADKLDYEFLGSRGIRVAQPQFMMSAFKNNEKQGKSIKLEFTNSNLPEPISFDLVNDPNNSRKWIDEERKSFIKLRYDIKKFPDLDSEDGNLKTLKHSIFDFIEMCQKNGIFPEKGDDDELIYEIFRKPPYNKVISNFILYYPEQSSLRKFDDTTQIYPLGIRGEGLFQHLKELASKEENAAILKQIAENLSLLDWYENFDIPGNLLSNEYALNIKDKYIADELKYFDQRSVNEGFLYLLFYFTLFLSKETPAFFAIDNIEASFNPKLCAELIRKLVVLSRENDKQVIITTHNPAILDGLNLENDDERLFVVRRNEDGHTKIRRIEYKKERKMKLSEIWTSGFIGGLPDNF